MAKSKRALKRPAGPKLIGDIATVKVKDEALETPTSDEIRRVMSALGKIGGVKGGKARAESLTAKRRSEIAKKAAAKRWSKK